MQNRVKAYRVWLANSLKSVNKGFEKLLLRAKEAALRKWSGLVFIMNSKLKIKGRVNSWLNSRLI